MKRYARGGELAPRGWPRERAGHAPCAPSARTPRTPLLRARTVFRVHGAPSPYDESGKRTYTVDERGRLTAFRYDDGGRLAKALYSFGTGKAGDDFEERLRAGLYPSYAKTGGRGTGDQADVKLGFSLPQISDFDQDSFRGELGNILHGKDDVYFSWRGVRPDKHGYWHLVPGDGATDFAEHLVPTGIEKQAIEAAARRAQGGRFFQGDRWLWTEQYVYDDNGNRLSKANGWGAIDYSYDAENRLQKAGNRAYGWDANGNLTSETLGSVQAVYAYGADNRVLDANTQVAGFVGRRHFGSSPTEGKDWELKSGVRYEYDALGRRVSRAEYATSESGFHADRRQWKTETVTTYQYDGIGMNVLREYRDTDYAPSLGFPWLPWFGSMGMRPRWGHRLGWPGSRWWDRVPSGKYRPMSEYLFGNDVESRTDWDPDQPRLTWKDTEYYHQDILGSVAALTDRYGVVRERYRYDAFGNQYEGSFQRINELGYNGKRYDGATGWYDYGFRDYEADVGRFTTVDPIRDGGNWYVYVGNDPVNFVDPWGLAQIYGDDAYGQAIAVFPGEDIKKDTSIKIERTGTSGYYGDTLKIKIRNQTAYTAPIQSTADMPEPRLGELNGKTLPTGEYTGRLLSQSYSYKNAIQLTGDFLIHPDQYTTEVKINDQIVANKSYGPWSQPYSAGCQILRLADFDSLTSTLKGLGHSYNGMDTIIVQISDATAKKGK